MEMGKPMKPLRIRYSEISTFLKCRKKHSIQWVREIEPRNTNDRFLVGTWGHAALKAMFLKQDAFEMVDKEVQDYREGKQYLPPIVEHMEMARVALVAAEKAYDALILEYEPVMVEETLFYDYSSTVQLTGTPDLVAKQRSTDAIWLFDHKFRSTFRPASSEDFNLQMFFYTKLLQLTKGLDVVGSRQLQIKPLEPKEPKITKDGKISRQNITTDWESFRHAVLANGEDPDSYLDMKSKLEDHKFLDWDTCAALRSLEEINEVWTNEILPAVGSIIQAHRHPGTVHPARCFDFGACNFCEVNSLCVAEMKNEDISVMMKSSYKQKGEKSQFVIVDFDG